MVSNTVGGEPDPAADFLAGDPDPAADFLAREQAELGEELGEELGISNGAPPVVADISGLSLEDQQEIEQVNQEVSYQFYINTLELTNLTNGRYCTRRFAILQSTIYRLIQGQQYFKVLQIAERDRAF